MDHLIVCRCNQVTVKMVREHLEDNEVINIERTLEKLKIGGRCNCCTKEVCPKVDVNYRELIK